MGNSTRPFANPNTRGKYPASALGARLRKQLFVGQTFLIFTDLIPKNESIVSV